MTAERGPLTTGEVYAAYERIVAKVETWVASSNPHVDGCNSADVRARLVQRIVQCTEGDLCEQIAGRPDLLRSATAVDAGGLRVSLDTGQASISIRQWVMSTAYFAVPWIELLWKLCIGLFAPSPSAATRATILTEAGGEYDESDGALVEFFRHGPVAPLSEATLLIVQSKRRPRRPTSDRVVYSPMPFVSMSALLPRSARRALLLAHLAAPLGLLRAVARCRLNALVSRDLALIPIVRWLDARNLLEAVVITTSAFPAQPLWARGLTRQAFKLHMLWYSQNFIPKMYAGDSTRPNLPAARHIRADVHWVWTSGFRDYLRELGSTADINVVGPLLWYLPGPADGVDRERLNIAAFDITPLPDGATAFGAAQNYYTVTRMRRFVADIVEVAGEIATETGRPVSVRLKHKRMPKVGRHDSSYLAWLEQMAATSPHLSLVDHRTNLFGFLEACDFSVSVPYTSTAYVGAHLRRPALYYDALADLVPAHERSPFVQFASGRAELGAMMRYALRPIDFGVGADRR